MVADAREVVRFGKTGGGHECAKETGSHLRRLLSLGTFMESDAPAPSRDIEATYRVSGMPCASYSLSATWFASHDEDVPLQPQHSSPEPQAHAEVVRIAPTPPKTVHARTQTLPWAGVDVATRPRVSAWLSRVAGRLCSLLNSIILSRFC